MHIAWHMDTMCLEAAPGKAEDQLAGLRGDHRCGPGAREQGPPSAARCSPTVLPDFGQKKMADFEKTW